MRHVAISLGAIGIAMFIGGCAAPEMLYELTPVTHEGVWYSGNEYVSETRDSVTVSVAFLDEIEGTITFYLAVGNGRSAPLFVDPGRIFYYAKYTEFKPHSKYVLTGDLEAEEVNYDTLRGTDTMYAYLPSAELHGIDRQMAQANATYANNSMMNLTAGLLQVVGDVATIGKKKSQAELHREREESRNIQESQANDNLNYSVESQSLSNQRAYWQNVALRKTTLFTGNTIGGQVRIRVDDRASTLKLVVPVGDADYVFHFKQKPLPGQG